MKPTKKTKSPPAPKPDNEQLVLESLVRSVDTLTDISNKLQIKVSRLDSWVDKLGERYSTELLSLRQQLDGRAYTQALTPAEPKRPKLEWREQGAEAIYWCIRVDPTTLILTPGTHMRYEAERNNVTTYDGVIVGSLDTCAGHWLRRELSTGAKLHAYLTTSRKLGIKLGRPV